MSKTETRVQLAVLGAGPTGIGAAWKLVQGNASPPLANPPEQEILPFLLLDESPTPGGRAASFTSPEGFTFDYGGHVLFPHPEYAEFTDLLDRVVSEWHSSTPVRGVWLLGELVPTPVQRNIHRLPLHIMISCLWGLWCRKPQLKQGRDQQREPTLREYLDGQFGKPLTRHVMGPLNRKMWAIHPDSLGSYWSSHRSGSNEKNIPDVGIRGVLRNLVLNRDEPGWREDTRVRYPLEGGKGRIWQCISDLIPSAYKRFGTRVVAIDTANRTLVLDDASTVAYRQLVTSVPIDSLLSLCTDRKDLQARAGQFRPTKVQLFGFGLRGPMPDMLKGVHAINIPSKDIPFWRVNFPSNFSPGNVPRDGNHWSLLCETSIAPGSDLLPERDQVEGALRRIGFIPPQTKVVSVFSSAIEHGYPAPFAGRDDLLNQVQRELELIEIYSRGRFGGWRYEVSNQDHAFMQGMEIVDRLQTGKAEYTYRKTW
jgi:protoporphyrinogen oxidase